MFSVLQEDREGKREGINIPVDTTDQNGDVSEDLADNDPFDIPPDGGLLPGQPSPSFRIPDEELQPKEPTHGHRRNLERDTRDDDVVSCLQQADVRIPRCGCNAAPCCLKDERAHIAADEDPGEEGGFEAGVLRAQGEDDVFQGEVDACRDERGCED